MLHPSYIPQKVVRQLRVQAVEVWALGLAIVLSWVLMIVLPALGLFTFAYTFFGYLCHQLPDRSLYLIGQPMAVCSRCFGVYVGILAGFTFYPLIRNVDNTEPPRRSWLFVAIIPAAVDWSLTVFGVWENTLWSRFVTGLILGAACAVFIVPAVVEVVWNLTRRRQANFR